MKKFRAVVLILLAVALAMIFWQQKTMERLRADNASLRAMTAELEQLRSENERLLKTAADSTELARLRKDQSELLRLRNETTKLREQLKNRNVATLPQKTVETVPPLVEESPVTTYVAEVKALLAPRETLVTGGWSITPGKRVFLFIEPGISEGTKDQVDITARFVEVPEENLSPDFAKMVTDGKQSSSLTVLTGEQMAIVLKEFQKLDVLAAPRVTTLTGRQSQVSVTHKETISGQQYDLGPMVDVLPEITPNGNSIRLTVSSKILTRTLAPP